MNSHFDGIENDRDRSICSKYHPFGDVSFLFVSPMPFLLMNPNDRHLCSAAGMFFSMLKHHSEASLLPDGLSAGSPGGQGVDDRILPCRWPWTNRCAQRPKSGHHRLRRLGA